MKVLRPIFGGLCLDLRLELVLMALVLALKWKGLGLVFFELVTRPDILKTFLLLDVIVMGLAIHLTPTLNLQALLHAYQKNEAGSVAFWQRFLSGH